MPGDGLIKDTKREDFNKALLAIDFNNGDINTDANLIMNLIYSGHRLLQQGSGLSYTQLRELVKENLFKKTFNIK